MCKSLKEYINRLSTHNEVLGILEFGGRFINDEKNDYSDYDMVVFTSHNLNSVTGVHFYLGTIPVDCMFISYTDEMDEQTLKKKKIFSDCRIVYQKDDFFSDKEYLLKGVDYKEEITDRVISATRYSISHTLYKIKTRLTKKDFEIEVGYYLSYLSTKCVQYYGILNQLKICHFHDYFEHMYKYNRILYSKFIDFFNTSNNQEKYIIIFEISNLILKAVGGIWKEGEVIYHSSSEINNRDDVNWIDRLLLV